MRIKNVFFGAILLAVPGFASAQVFANSNFTQGDTGFTTDYNYATTQGSLLTSGGPSISGGGYFGIGNNPNFFHPYWTGPAFSGNAMIVDGGLTPNQTVWQESLSSGLTVGKQYEFTFDIANLYPQSPATLQLSIDGVNAGSLLTAGNAGNDVMVAQSVLFTATNATPTFSLVDTNTAFSGNDFAITQMGVQAVPAPTNIACLGLGILGLALRKRTRKA